MSEPPTTPPRETPWSLFLDDTLIKVHPLHEDHRAALSCTMTTPPCARMGTSTDLPVNRRHGESSDDQGRPASGPMTGRCPQSIPSMRHGGRIGVHSEAPVGDGLEIARSGITVDLYAVITAGEQLGVRTRS